MPYLWVYFSSDTFTVLGLVSGPFKSLMWFNNSLMRLIPWVASHFFLLFSWVALVKKGGGKALIMTMTPCRNLPHGQWPKNWLWPWQPRFRPWLKLTNFDHMTMLTLNFRRWSWSKMIKFDHMTAAILKFWLCSWSNIFDHMTITPGYTCLVVKKSWSSYSLLDD